MEPSTVEAHLAALLREIDPFARLKQCTETFGGGWYGVVISRAGRLPKSLVLPKDLVLSAPTKPEAQRALREILLTALRVDQSHSSIERSRETLATREAAVPSPLICPRCSKAIRPGESVRFEHGAVMHILCEPR
jgi:hypothetical protein